MNDLPPETEELLLAFLDGDLPPHQLDQVEKMLEADQRVAEYLELQEQISGSLQRVFSPPALDPEFLRELAEPQTTDEEQVSPAPVASAPTRRLVLATLATAASLSIVWLSVRSFVATPETTIAYRERPLVEVYQQCVRDGFEPYWVCDNPDLFAATFERRQGVQLKLGELPAGQEMLGLSYLAGLSRDSTSMLAMVEGQRVIVIVDRVENDWRPETGLFEEAGLRVIRWEQYRLAFYQVSPPDTPRLDEAFGLADAAVTQAEEPSR